MFRLYGSAHQETDVRYWSEVEEAVETLHEPKPLEAILELRDVLRASSRNYYAYHFLGIALFETGELEAARDAYRAALILAPDYLGARVHLSHVLRMLGNAREAVQQAEFAHKQAPNDPEVWHALGMAYAQRGNKENARRWLEAYLHSNPEFEVSLEVRAILEQLGPAPNSEDES